LNPHLEPPTKDPFLQWRQISPEDLVKTTVKTTMEWPLHTNAENEDQGTAGIAEKTRVLWIRN
jgi:hypothetical protein